MTLLSLLPESHCNQKSCLSSSKIWFTELLCGNYGFPYPNQVHEASLVAQIVKICLWFRRTGLDPLVGKIPWRRERLPIPVLVWRISPWGRKELDTTERVSLSGPMTPVASFHVSSLREVKMSWLLFTEKSELWKNKNLFLLREIIEKVQMWRLWRNSMESVPGDQGVRLSLGRDFYLW